MRRRALLLLLAACLLLTGCVLKPVSFRLDEQGNYTGFRTMAEGYTRRAARLYGWVVWEGLTVTENGKVWQRFQDRAARGKEAGVRIAEFFGDEMCLMDVFYHDGQYRVFFSDGFDLRDEPFPQMVTLTGETNGQPTYAVVLTGDDSLTYGQVMHKFFSAQLLDDDIPAHRILFLGTGEPNW